MDSFNKIDVFINKCVNECYKKIQTNKDIPYIDSFLYCCNHFLKKIVTQEFYYTSYIFFSILLNQYSYDEIISNKEFIKLFKSLILLFSSKNMILKLHSLKINGNNNINYCKESLKQLIILTFATDSTNYILMFQNSKNLLELLKIIGKYNCLNKTKCINTITQICQIKQNNKDTNKKINEIKNTMYQNMIHCFFFSTNIFVEKQNKIPKNIVDLFSKLFLFLFLDFDQDADIENYQQMEKEFESIKINIITQLKTHNLLNNYWTNLIVLLEKQFCSKIVNQINIPKHI